MIVDQMQPAMEHLLAARQIVSSALASALADPRSTFARRCDNADRSVIMPAWAEAARRCGPIRAEQLGIGERPTEEANVASLVQWLDLPAERRERVHQEVFGLVMTKLCPSYETEYCEWKDATHRAQEMADIAGFYNAFGVRPARALPERVDHASLEIELIALLLEKELRACAAKDDQASEHIDVCRTARQAFLRDHVAWWMPTFGRLLEKRACDLAESKPAMTDELRRLAGVAQVLCAWVAIERIAADVEPSRRLISPSVPPQEADDGCGTCTGCTP